MADFFRASWELAAAIFALRIVDVSLGTLRTISVVQGRMKLSVLPGFFEVLVWLTAISQVLAGMVTNPLLIVAYAGGFASGNGVGILLERKLALGNVILRIVSAVTAGELADRLRIHDVRVTAFSGMEQPGAVVLLYVVCHRRDVRLLLEEARRVDPVLFYALEPIRETNARLSHPLPYFTGWRTVFKKK